MNAKLNDEIQAAQFHGRQKWGGDPNNTEHDDQTPEHAWHDYIANHNQQARLGTPMERRAHLVKVAGLAVSAIEAFDRR